MLKGGHVRKKTKRSENELLTVVSKMAYDLRHEDQMALARLLWWRQRLFT